MIKEIWNSWWFQNLLVVLLLAVLTLIGWRLSRREYWRLAYREVRQRRGAVICFFVLCLYVVIALADSVGWRRALKEGRRLRPRRLRVGLSAQTVVGEKGEDVFGADGGRVVHV